MRQFSSVKPMGVIAKYLQWVYWNLHYWRHPNKSRDFTLYIEELMRCRWPWRKFKPCAYHNNAGQQWHVYLFDGMPVYSRETITLEVGRCHKTGRVLEFTIWDEKLRPNGESPTEIAANTVKG